MSVAGRRTWHGPRGAAAPGLLAGPLWGSIWGCLWEEREEELHQVLPQTLLLTFHPDEPNSPQLPELHSRGTGVLEPWHKREGVWALLLITLPRTGGKLSFTLARSPFMAGPPRGVCFLSSGM